MILYRNEDITVTDCEAIAHGVNCQGAMNSGVARAIRDKWPIVYENYRLNYEYFTNFEKPLLGRASSVKIHDHLYVFNCFTQQFYGKDGKKYASKTAIYESLKEALKIFYLLPLDRSKGFAIPKIGCGLGGLNWETDVRPIIEYLSEKTSIDFVVYEI